MISLTFVLQLFNSSAWGQLNTALNVNAANDGSNSVDNTVTYLIPGITCPSDRTVSTDAGTCSAIVNNIDPIVSPADATLNYYISSTGESGAGSVSGKSFPLGMSRVTYTLPDYPGISCSFTITVEDHTPPVITCPPNLTVKCTDEVPLAGGVTATDGCSQPGFIDVKLVSEVITNATCPSRYTITRTYKATDQSGNSSTCTQIITVYDDEAPHFLQPPPVSPLTVSCTNDVPIVYPTTYTAYDNCFGELDEDIIAQFKQVKTDSTCPNKYTLTRTWTAIDACGNEAIYTQVIHVDDKQPPEFKTTPLSLIPVHCASDIPVAPVLTATDNCTGAMAIVSLNEVISDQQCANKFKLTRTWTATDACGNTSTASQIITVNDTQAPVFNGTAPSSVNVSCSKDIPAAVTQTATDNCGGSPTITYSEVKTNVQCVNKFILTRTWIASDACGNTTIRMQTIIVDDKEPPKVTGISADPVVLWPPNHKMSDVTINYTATDNCGVTSTLSVTSSDPVNGGSDGDQAPDWEIIDAHHVRLRAEKSNNGQARFYTIKISITDGCNASVDTSVTVVVAHNITSPQTGNPFKIGSSVSFNGVFWDKPCNTHTAKWLLDGSAVTNGSATEPSGNQNGKVSGSYKFNTAGVYKLQMNVTDQTGITSYANTNNDLDAIVVVYDPNGGNAYGGGWFQSQAGALAANPLATGKASYGFAVNYSNAAKPKGETQFEFKVGSFEFNALNFDYLAINNAKAQFRGTGKIIGGQSGIGFIMTVKDGAIDGSGIDKIRMKIYNRNTGYVYYDNQPGTSDADDPTAGVGTNSSVVIQEAATVNSATTTSREVMEVDKQEKSFDKLQVVAYPNPTNKYFSIQIKTNDLKTTLQMQTFDKNGKLLERRNDIVPGSIIRLGETYRAGIYFAQFIQGQQRTTVKLVKR